MKVDTHSLLRWNGTLNVLLLAILAQAGVAAAASAPPLFTYQGQLVEVVNGQNVPVKNGADDIFSVDLYIRLYSSMGAAKADALYARRVSALVNAGYFTVDIGDECGVPLAPAVYTNLLSLLSNNDSSTLLVGVTPISDANDEIGPRQALFAAPYALLANDVTQALGDFTATNGTSLFPNLEVTGDTVFKGTVSNLAPVAIQGNVTFTKGLTNTSATVVKQLTAGRTLQQTQQSTLVSGNLTVQDSATVQAGGLVSVGATFHGNVTAPEVTVQGTMAAGNLTASQLSVSNLTCASTLTVQGKAVFGARFPGHVWRDRSDGDVESGSYTAPQDGLFVATTILRRDNADGQGHLWYVLAPTSGGTPEVWFTPTIYTAGAANGTDENTFSILMKQGEVLRWGWEQSDAEDTPSRVEYRVFDGL